ncbi:MAG: S49 family peptidase [Phycisphaerae bacterium]
MAEDSPQNAQFPAVADPPSQPQAGQAQPVVAVCPYGQPHKKSRLARAVTYVLVLAFILSLVANAYLYMGLEALLRGPLATKVITKGNPKEVVAVWELNGVIFDEAARSFNEFCKTVTEDKDVKAVVLRVNSPGGGISASDEIHEGVMKLKADGKKVVVSMGDLAASGGYYISAPADEIIAEPTTITGSIGVIMEWMVVEKGLGKLGIEPVVLKSGHAQLWKDELSWLSQPNDIQRKHLQGVLDTMQARFEKIVKEGRVNKAGACKIATSQVTYTTTMPAGGEVKTVQFTETEPFNGKIYMAEEAKKISLVDDIGYLDDAIKRAQKLANISGAQIVQYQQRKGLLSGLMGANSSAGVSIDSKLIDDLQTPRILMQWKGQ